MRSGKRFLKVMAAVCAAGLLCGCGAKNATEDEADKTKQEASEETKARIRINSADENKAGDIGNEGSKEKENGAEDWYELADGILSVSLPAGINTGFEWKYETSEPDTLDTLNVQFMRNENGKNKDGVSGIWHAAFEGVGQKEGKVQLSFRYSKDEILKEFRWVELAFGKDGSIQAVTVANVEKMSDSDISDAGELTLEAVLKKNGLLNLMEEHSALVFEQEILDADGEKTAEGKGEFITHEGHLWYEAEYTYGTEGRVLYSAYEADDMPGASYALCGPVKQMTLYPSAEYREFLADLWFPLKGSEEETLKNQSYQDGAAVLETVTKPAKTGEYRSTFYFVKPETGLLHAVEAHFYGVDGKETGISRTFISYDEPYLPQSEAQMMITASEDPCSLTVILENSLTGTKETQKFSVAKDCLVTLGSKEPYMLFQDAGYEKVLGGFDVSGDTCTVYASVGSSDMEVGAGEWEEEAGPGPEPVNTGEGAKNQQARKFAGKWLDSYSQRANMEITDMGSYYTVTVRWADSAFEWTEWRMNAVPEKNVEDKRLVYADGRKYQMSSDEKGTITETLVYENGNGDLNMRGDSIYWVDMKEDAAMDCLFERMEE